MNTTNSFFRLNVDPTSSLFNTLKNCFGVKAHLKCAQFFIGDEANYIIQALAYNLLCNYTVVCEDKSQTQKVLQILFSLDEHHFSIQEKQNLSQTFNITIKDPEYYLNKSWRV